MLYFRSSVLPSVATAQVRDPRVVGDGDCVQEDTAKRPLLDNDTPVERLVLRGDNLPWAAPTVGARRMLTAGLIHLDVSNTRLENAGIDLVVAWTPWLRELLAAGGHDSGNFWLPGVLELVHVVAYRDFE